MAGAFGIRLTPLMLDLVPFRSRRVLWAIGAALLLAVFILAAAGLWTRVPSSSAVLRQRLITEVADRLSAEVELGDLSLRAFPNLRAVGKNLRIRHKGRRDVPPLISVDEFVVDASIRDLWRYRVGRVNLKGLDIVIPPGTDEARQAERSDADDGERGLNKSATRAAVPPFVIDELVADNAKLSILPRDKDKNPKVWVMHELHLQNVGTGQQMPFRSILTNAIPPGEIDTTGSFGPWNVESPRRTALDGAFTFDRADLSVFEGVSGILSAHGSYAGTLGRIDVRGETNTPDFMIKVSRHTIPLKTSYHAIVDATNGDTVLDPVDASFLNTSLQAKGGVFDVKGASGRLVRLQVTIDKGRLEDLMRLAVNAPRPPMTGALRLRTAMEIPPGKRDVVEKLRLDGRFAISGGRFTDASVQQKINELSRRARGRAAVPEPPKVTSDFSGQFKLGNGTLALDKLTFDIPGAVVEVNGSYGLRRETLDFGGNLFMDAKISQTVTGFKSLLLKVIDPLFRREGRTVVPIKITGSRSNPSFGLDVRRVLRREKKPS